MESMTKVLLWTSASSLHSLSQFIVLVTNFGSQWIKNKIYFVKLCHDKKAYFLLTHWLVNEQMVAQSDHTPPIKSVFCNQDENDRNDNLLKMGATCIFYIVYESCPLFCTNLFLGEQQ